VTVHGEHAADEFAQRLFIVHDEDVQSWTSGGRFGGGRGVHGAVLLVMVGGNS
jgi:hypothetical protein